MKRAALLLALFSLIATSCGLKVPTTVVAGSDAEAGGQLVDDTGLGGPATGPSDGIDTGPGLENGGKTPETKIEDPTDTGTSVFNSETEGVTKDKITLCAHVPITGAAPIPHHPDRFGQFYFNYVNKELGGVHGRQVSYKAFDDGYYPAGARAAAEKCAREGSFVYIGAAGTDQIVSVARWAERKRVPYFHGPTSDKDLGAFTYNIFGGPTYEYQHRLLADYLIERYGKNKRYGMVRVSSPYFQAGHDAYVDQLKKHGITLTVDKVVQKDESQFQDVYYELSKAGKQVDVINNFTTPNIWIKMLQQKPPGYNPTFTAVSPVAGFNILAVALANSNSKAVVFHHFNPACNCTDYESGLDTTVPWINDEREFLRIFKKYSPEQKPPPDDFDYGSYLAAKAFHRILLAVGPQPTRTKLFTLLKTYKENPAKVAPGCGADFTRGVRRGAWFTNIFELKVGKWKQIATCVDKV